MDLIIKLSPFNSDPSALIFVTSEINKVTFFLYGSSTGFSQELDLFLIVYKMLQKKSNSAQVLMLKP